MQRPFSVDSVWELLSHLASLTPRGFIVFEARAKEGAIHYLIGAEMQYFGRIHEVFHAHQKVQFYKTGSLERKPMLLSCQLKISKPVLSLNTDAAAAAVRATLAALSAVNKDEEAVVQIVLGSSYKPSSVSKDIPNPSASWLEVIMGTAGKASPESRKSAKEKAEQHGFQCLVRVGVSKADSNYRINNIISALKTLESAGVRIHTKNTEPMQLNAVQIPWQMPLRLSVKEIAAFLLLPAGEEELAGTSGLHPKPKLAPNWYQEPEQKSLDRTFAVGMNGKKLSISPSDALEHTHILGPTGSGKSTVMLNLIMADINDGRSVLVIDPKADLVRDVLERIPNERTKDVVVIDPSDANPTGFNPLAFKSHNPTLIADAVLAVLKQIFKEYWGIRTQDILSAALLTLVQTKGSSLLWLPTLLTDEAFRKKITASLTDRIGLIPFWENFEAMNDSKRNLEIAPVLNKLRQLTVRPGLRNVLGQAEPKFSFTDLFFKRRIVLVPLNRGIIGTESARLLGSLVVGLTWTLALSRADIPPEKRHTVCVYIDELQDYVSLPTDLSDALAQARGLGVAMTLAHQYRNQLPLELRSGIDTNARNKIIFGLSSADAKETAAMAADLEAIDFMSLPRYEVYTCMQNGGRNTGWIRAKTLAPIKPVRMAAELKAESMALYGRPEEEIEKELLKLLNIEDESLNAETDAPIGRRKHL